MTTFATPALRALGTRRFIGKAPCCRTVVVESRGAWLTSIEAVCPTHRAVVFTLRAIKGKPGARSCDARCTSARTKDCECQCAGANHGRDHEWKAET